MKTKDLFSKSKEELESQLVELKKELIKLNAQVATGTNLKSPGQVSKIKKNIAKILTVLKRK
ncbi:MAG: 50S ribosomal protein L29 [Candidatus Woesearchaeota archaeon]